MRGRAMRQPTCDIKNLATQLFGLCVLCCTLTVGLMMPVETGMAAEKSTVPNDSDKRLRQLERLTDIGIVSVNPTKTGPYQVGDRVPVEIRVRNNRGFHAEIAIGLKHTMPGRHLEVITDKKWVKTGMTVIYETTITLSPKDIRLDRFEVQLVLIDTKKSKAQGKKAQLWQDYNAANNHKDFALHIDSKGLFDVRADLLRIHFSTVCQSEPSQLEKISIRAHGFVTKHLVAAENIKPDPVLIVKRSQPQQTTWPKKGRWYHPVKPGQTVRPHISLKFSKVADTQFLYLYVNVAIGKRNFNFFDRKTIPGSAVGSLKPTEWIKSGTYQFISAYKKSINKQTDCPVNGTYTAVWQVSIMPSKLDAKLLKKIKK